MPYTLSQYADALWETVKDKTESEQKPILTRFFLMLRRHKKTAMLERILQRMDTLSLKEQGVMKVTVSSASPLTKEVKQKIARAMGDGIILEEHTVPGLLAGITIRIGGELLIDASGKTQVKRMLA